MSRPARQVKNDYNASERKPHAIDVHVGKRIRMRRCLLNISQEKLAEAVNLTFQQIQKYERGTNRVSASRLFQFARILDVPVNYFYQEYTEGRTPGTRLPANMVADSADGNAISEEMVYSKEAMELLRIYYGIEDEKKRKDFIKLIRTMADTMR